MTEQNCDLIGAWKFLSTGPRIPVKLTRPFSSLEVGSGDDTGAYMNDRQACAMQSKLNVTSHKMVHYCIPVAQLDVHEVTRPSFSRRLKGVACETNNNIIFGTIYIIGSKWISLIVGGAWCSGSGVWLDHNPRVMSLIPTWALLLHV